MGDLSKNFSRYEFRCRCGCGRNTVDFKTLEVLEEIREHFGVGVIPSSAHRCEEYNKTIGGSENSQHLRGRAVDFIVEGVEAADVQSYLKFLYPDKYGIGCYDNFTHIDTRSGPPARW